jgi:hypothetical protein
MTYDETDIAQRYDSARHMPEETLRLWLDAMARHVQPDDMRTIVDVGFRLREEGRTKCCSRRSLALAPLSFRVAMTSDVKRWSQRFQVMLLRVSLVHWTRRRQ